MTHAPGSGGGEGLSPVALRRQAALALARLRRRLLRAVPPGLRQSPDVEPRAALPAVQGVAQDHAAARVAGASEPRHVRERGEVRRRRHVRQGLPGHSRPRTSSPPRRASSSRSTKRSSSMAVRPAPLERPAPVAGRTLSLRGFVEREGTFSWLMLAPGVLFLLAFVAYPFFYGIYLSLQDRPVARTGVFIGLGQLRDARPRRGVLAGHPQHVRLHHRHHDPEARGRARAWPS